LFTIEWQDSRRFICWERRHLACNERREARTAFQLNITKDFVRASRSLQARCLRSRLLKANPVTQVVLTL
jgi:hypothetical protein